MIEDIGSMYDLRFNINYYGADYPIDSLVRKMENKEIYVPDFQRQYVWKVKEASLFIESILLGLPERKKGSSLPLAFVWEIRVKSRLDPFVFLSCFVIGVNVLHHQHARRKSAIKTACSRLVNAMVMHFVFLVYMNKLDSLFLRIQRQNVAQY